MEVDSRLDRWVEGKKSEKMGVTLLVTVSTFKMPGPEEVKWLEREGSGRY